MTRGIIVFFFQVILKHENIYIRLGNITHKMSLLPLMKFTAWKKMPPQRITQATIQKYSVGHLLN